MAGELVGVIEPFPLADLGARPQRGQRVDPAQAPQPSDRVRAQCEIVLREGPVDDWRLG